MNSAKRQFIPRLALLMLSWAVFSVSSAESLNDPTRPFGMTSPGEAATPASAAQPVLQSILVAPDRRAAIISGKFLQVGDFYGKARVSRITDTEVTLARGRDEQVLKLFTGLEKRVHISPAVRGAAYVSGN